MSKHLILNSGLYTDIQYGQFDQSLGMMPWAILLPTRQQLHNTNQHGIH